MNRLLVKLLFLHHIEGVCKPFATVGQAAARAVGRIMDGIATAGARRDWEAARLRATERQAAQLERVRRAAAARQAVITCRAERLPRAAQGSPVVGSRRTPPRAVEAPKPVVGFMDHIRHNRQA